MGRRQRRAGVLRSGQGVATTNRRARVSSPIGSCASSPRSPSFSCLLHPTMREAPGGARAAAHNAGRSSTIRRRSSTVRRRAMCRRQEERLVSGGSSAESRSRRRREEQLVVLCPSCTSLSSAAHRFWRRAVKLPPKDRRRRAALHDEVDAQAATELDEAASGRATYRNYWSYAATESEKRKVLFLLLYVLLFIASLPQIFPSLWKVSKIWRYLMFWSFLPSKNLLTREWMTE